MTVDDEERAAGSILHPFFAVGGQVFQSFQAAGFLVNLFADIVIKGQGPQCSDSRQLFILFWLLQHVDKLWQSFLLHDLKDGENTGIPDGNKRWMSRLKTSSAYRHDDAMIPSYAG